MKNNKSIYWAALTNGGIETIIKSDLTSKQIKLFFLFVNHFMDKEDNTIHHSIADIYKELKDMGLLTLSKPALYTALNKLAEEQLIAPLAVTKGYMINPFIIYYGKVADHNAKLEDFEKVANLTYNSDEDNPFADAKFIIDPKVADNYVLYRDTKEI